MEFFSLGMFCVDEIHNPDKSYLDIIGGAGTYAALGAGVVVPRSDRHNSGFICDEGFDFSAKMKQEMETWELGIHFRKDESRETTKAWNKFVNNEERLFKYLSPKLQIFPKDLPTKALNASAIHLICSPDRCDEIMQELEQNSETNPTTKQKYIWEPVPTQCIPSQFENLKRVVSKYQINVLSPNALEAAALVGLPEPNSKQEVEDLDRKYFQFAPTIVIRCGSMGSYLRSGSFIKWYPAYFINEPARVVDPSGAGNAFTGALGLGLSRNLKWDEAMAYGSVGASFMIEQVGTPHYDPKLDFWNGESGPERVQKYLNRI